jgi:hypothetical protein
MANVLQQCCPTPPVLNGKPYEEFTFSGGPTVPYLMPRPRTRGMDHPEKCPLCYQEEEIIQHLLTKCVFSRQVWFAIFLPLEVGGAMMCSNKHSFANWWAKTICKVKKESRKRVSSLIILTSWLIWRHRNACVLDGIVPSVD